MRGVCLFYGRRKTGQEVDLPILAELRYLPARQMMLLAHGDKAQGHDAASLGNWLRARCDEAAPYGCSADRLRKAGARRLSEAGATEWEVMAFLAHKTAKEASRYVAEANRIRLTTSGMARLTSMEGEQISSNLPKKLDNGRA